MSSLVRAGRGRRLFPISSLAPLHATMGRSHMRRSLASALCGRRGRRCMSHNANVPNAKLLLFPSLKGKPRILVHSIIHRLSVFGRLAQTCIQFPVQYYALLHLNSYHHDAKRVKSYLELEILFEGCSQGRERGREKPKWAHAPGGTGDVSRAGGRGRTDGRTDGGRRRRTKQLKGST